MKIYCVLFDAIPLCEERRSFAKENDSQPSHKSVDLTLWSCLS